MEFEVRETGSWKRELHVRLSEEEVRQEMRAVVREFRRKTSLPGFRKGKVPEAVIEQRFGDYLEDELINRIIPKAYREALERSGLDPITQGNVRDFSYKRGQPLSFVADLEIRPKVAIEGFEGIKVVKRVFEVADEEVEATLRMIQEQNATHEPVSRPAADGDRLRLHVVDLDEEDRAGKESSGEGEGDQETTVELGSPGLFPEFQAALTGVGVDTEKEVEITYPEDASNEELRGRAKRFRVKVLEIAEKKRPELDDNLAVSLGFENLDDLRSRIRIRLEGEEMLRGEREMEETIIRQIAERNTFEAPESMVRNLLDGLAEDYQVPEDKRDEFRKQQTEGATRAVKRMLILDAIARQHDLSVGDDEVEAALREGIEDEREAARAVKEARDGGRFGRLRHQMLERKVLDLLVDRAEVEEVTATRPPAPQPAPAE